MSFLQTQIFSFLQTQVQLGVVEKLLHFAPAVTASLCWVLWDEGDLLQASPGSCLNHWAAPEKNTAGELRE